MSYGRVMGVTEIVLSFDFAESTPDHVLAAFSALAAPNQPDDAPALPDPVIEVSDLWDPIWGQFGLPEGQGAEPCRSMRVR